MTRNRNNTNKKVLGVNPDGNKSKKQKLIEKRMVRRNAGKQDFKDNKVVQVIKNVNESDSNKSDSMKKPISDKPKNSPIKNENNSEKKNKNNSPIKENAKQNMNKNTQKKNSKGEENSAVFSKPKNIHRMKEEVDTVPCPKDIKIQMSHRQFDRNDCTLFVRFGRETGQQDREILKKTFAEKVKEIRDHKRYRNLNYVEFESREELEEMKSQIEQMKTAGDKPFVDYMGDKGKKDLEDQEMEINPKKLFISNLPKGTTPSQIKPLFQKCSKVTIPKKDKSYGFIFFNEEGDAKAGFESAQNLKIGGSDVLVVFSKTKTNEIKSDKKRPLTQDNEKENKVNESPSKKLKITKDEKEHEKDQEEEDDKAEETKVNNEQENMDEDEDSDEDEEGDDKDSEESENDDDDEDDDDDDEEDDDDDDDDDDDEEEDE